MAFPVAMMRQSVVVDCGIEGVLVDGVVVAGDRVVYDARGQVLRIGNRAIDGVLEPPPQLAELRMAVQQAQGARSVRDGEAPVALEALRRPASPSGRVLRFPSME